MKRNFLLIMLLLVTGILLLSGCNASESDADGHTPCDTCTFGEWTVLLSPTCSAEGSQTRTCSVCGSTETTPIAKTECSFGEWSTVTEPTAETVGVKVRTCTVCGAEESEEIPKMIPRFSISCKNGNKTTVVTAEEDGSYVLTTPTRVGYRFMGWQTESGTDFAATGTLTANVKVIAQWKVEMTTTFAQLKERTEAGAAEIVLDADIELSQTVYVTGDTTIYVTADHTLTRSPSFGGDLFVIGENAEGKNSILITGKVATLTLRTEEGAKLTLDGNKENMTVDVGGTGFFLLNSSILNLYDNVTVTNCKKVGNIRLLEDDENISNSHSVGGAAAIVADGTLNLYGATISDCEVNTQDKVNVGTPEENYYESNRGGAIFNRSTVKMYSGTLKNNKASRGGAIFNYREVDVKGGLIQNNYAETYGGAIYLGNTQYAKLKIGEACEEIKLTIRGNSSQKSGGALFGLQQSVIWIYGGVEFSENKSLTANGGAINMVGALNVEGGLFEKNLAASKGGAIYAYYSGEQSTIREVNITGGLFRKNEASKGGALGIGASQESCESGANVIICGATFEENRAFLTEVEDPDFIDNVDRDGVTKAENGRGGAIYVFWKGKLTISGSTKLQNNLAENRGGAIYVTSEGSSVTVTGTADIRPLFQENEANDHGGAIYSYSDTAISISNADFRKNVAAGNGGAIYGKDNSILVSGASFYQNKASGAEYGGGAAYFTGATASFTNTGFEENESLTKNGGAVCGYSSTVLTMNDVTLTGNVAADNGGAICINKSSLTVNTTIVLNNNEAGGDGGAIHMKESTMTANAITAAGNTAEGGGGAIYLNKADSANEAANLVVTTLTVAQNSAGGNGGALYFHTYAVAEIGTLIATENVSESYGGAIYASTKDRVVITTVTATENEAADKGGFLYLTTGGTVVTIYGGSISGNSAANGGETAYSNSTSAVLQLPATGITYPDNTISGKSGFAVTILPVGGNA